MKITYDMLYICCVNKTLAGIIKNEVTWDLNILKRKNGLR